MRALKPKLAWIDDVLDYYVALARSRFDADAGRDDFAEFLTDHVDSILFTDATSELARLVEAEGNSSRAIVLADRYGRGGPDGVSAASVCLSAGRLLAKKEPAQAFPYLQCARTKATLSAAARSAFETLSALRKDHPELRPSGAQAL